MKNVSVASIIHLFWHFYTIKQTVMFLFADV